MLLTVDLDEHLVDVKCIAKSPVLALQSAGVDSSELDAPEADRLASDDNASLGEKIFDIAMTEIEFVVEPNGVTNDVWWESVALVSIHLPILSKPAF